MPQPDWLTHNQLQIVKGFGAVPGDSTSAELPPVVVNLLSGAITLTSDGWSPNIPAVENGGVWTDSPITDGRQLLAAPVGNVTEKIVVNVTGSTAADVFAAMDSLNRIAQDCRDFWQSQTQINPVYLLWYASCAAGPQYALAYNIEVAPTFQAGPKPAIQASITIEREPYWRGVAPGANPKIWTYYVKTGNQSFNNNNANLLTLTDDLLYDTGVKNRMEWNTVDYVNVLSRNYVDIPAASIPGDAPALLSLGLSLTGSSNGNPQMYIGKSTKPTSLKDRTGATFPQAYNFNAGDAQTPSNWTKTVDATCGCISNRSSTTKYTGVNTTLAAGTYNSFALWGYDSTSLRNFDFNVLRGTYAVFLRCKQLTGSLGDVKAQLVYFENGNTIATGQFASWPVLGAPTVCVNRFDILYMGQLSFPAGNKAYGSPDGLGLNVVRRTRAQTSGQNIGINVVNSAGAARSIEFLDLILIPIDEGAIELIGTDFLNQIYFQYDNTGYLTHGNTTPLAVQTAFDTNETYMSVIQSIGQDITLTPKVNNRLYFLLRYAVIGAPATGWSAPDSTLNDFVTVHVNIVPRWSSIRDA